MIVELVTTPYNVSFYTYKDVLLMFKRRLVVGKDQQLREQIMSYMHCSGVGGHSGVTTTYQRFAAIFW